MAIYLAEIKDDKIVILIISEVFESGKKKEYVHLFTLIRMAVLIEPNRIESNQSNSYRSKPNKSLHINPFG